MLADAIPHGTPRRLSRAEYERIGALGLFRGERVELIHGIVVRMAPIGTAHADVVDRLAALLIRQLGDRARVRIQQPFTAWDDSEPQPDIAVVPAGSYAERHPAEASLIVEVAESSLDYDRETKAPLYAASGVSEYWIVDVPARAIHVLSEPSNGRYHVVRLIDSVDALAPRDFADLRVTLADLFG